MLHMTRLRISGAAASMLRWMGLTASNDRCACGRTEPLSRSYRGYDAAASYALAL